MAEDLPSFMDKYLFRYFRVSENHELFVAALFYFSSLPTILSNELGMNVSNQYAPKILPILLQGFEKPAITIQLPLSCSFVIDFCGTCDDEEKIEPYLQPLMEKLLALSNDDNAMVRRESIFAICSVLNVSDNSFVKYGDTAIKQFRKLLATGGKKTRDIVMEALGGLGTSLNVENKARIATDVKELYSQVVEEFKNDRESNEELVLKLTEFAVSSLGKDYTPFLPIVLPVLLQKASAATVDIIVNDDAMELSSDEEVDENTTTHTITQRTDMAASAAKDSALSALGKILEWLDTEVLQPYLAQISDCMATTLVSPFATADQRTICIEGYEQYLIKHRLSSEMCRNEAELNAIVAVFDGFFDLDYVDPSTKETAVKALNKIVHRLCTFATDLASNDNVLRQSTSLLLKVIIRFIAELTTFDEKRNFGCEIMEFASNIFSKVLNKQHYLETAGALVFVL